MTPEMLIEEFALISKANFETDVIDWFNIDRYYYVEDEYGNVLNNQFFITTKELADYFDISTYHCNRIYKRSRKSNDREDSVIRINGTIYYLCMDIIDNDIIAEFFEIVRKHFWDVLGFDFVGSLRVKTLTRLKQIITRKYYYLHKMLRELEK